MLGHGQTGSFTIAQLIVDCVISSGLIDHLPDYGDSPFPPHTITSFPYSPILTPFSSA